MCWGMPNMVLDMCCVEPFKRTVDCLEIKCDFFFFNNWAKFSS